MKKKKRTPEQQVKRGKRALAILAAMGVVCLISMLVQKCEGEQANDVSTVMDAHLDSLMTLNAHPNYKIISKTPHSLCRYVPRCLQEDTLDGLELKIRLSGISCQEIIEAEEKIIKLKDYINAYRNDENNLLVYYNRRLKFIGNDGRSYTCIQTIDTNLVETRFKHLVCLDEIQLSEDEKKEFLNNF